jgi:hypothetical protein
MKYNWNIWIAENPTGDIADQGQGSATPLLLFPRLLTRDHRDLRRTGVALSVGDSSVRLFIPTRTADLACQRTERKGAGRSKSNWR